VEPDPAGAHVGFEDPTLIIDPGPIQPETPMFIGGFDWPDGRCQLDGMPVGCGSVQRLMDIGAVQSETLLYMGSSRGWQVIRDDIISYGGGLFSTIAYTLDSNREIRGDSYLFTLPQNYDPRADFRDCAVQLSNDESKSDCLKLSLLAYKAGQVSDDPIGILMTGLTEVGNRFRGDSDPQYRVGVLRRDPFFAQSFGQRGFNGNYQGGGFINNANPNDNQVRHFVGWLAASYYHSNVTSTFARQLLYNQEGTRSVNDPDVALGLAAIDLGADFNGDYKKLAQDIWHQICGESSNLSLP
jgi:hypothetical protein